MGADSSAGTGGPEAVPKLTDEQRRRGMQSITGLALSGQAVGTLTGGAFIVAVLVAYDAPLYVYGLLAALPSLAGVLQVPAAYLVERYRKRKQIAFAAFSGMRLVGLVFALVPILAAPETGTVLILAAVFAKSLAGAVSGPAWNSMVRDIVTGHACDAGWYADGAGAGENVTPHYFRHFFTTHLRDRIGDRGVVKYLRGDVADDIIDTYTHNWGDRVREVYEANVYSLV